MVEGFHLPTGSKVWVTQMGPSTHLSTELANLPDFRLAPHDFGSNIHFFDITVGQNFPYPTRLPKS